MVNFNGSLFLQDSKDKQLKITYDNGVITNEMLHSENFILEESICSDNRLVFGSCESSSVKFRVQNIFESLKDKEIAITETIEGSNDVFEYGVFKVHSDKPTADRKFRDIVAYDFMYDILNADVSEWYNAILPNENSTVTLKEFRDSFFEYFGIEQVEITLPNDLMVVQKTIDTTSISGKLIINSICEINGCFGKIARNGKFKYVFLSGFGKSLFPANNLFPSNKIYPSNVTQDTSELSKSHYISAKYEDYKAQKIDKVQIRQEENDIGASYGNGTNCYIIQGNFLVFGKGSEELTEVAKNAYSKMHDVYYTPAQINAKGNPCIEVGDGIQIETNNKTINTYVLNRTLKGIQSLRDTYESNGEEYQSEEVNSVENSIIQLKGKGNILTRTVEETRSYIYDTEQRLSSEILQQAGEIALRVRKDQIISEINLTPEQITISANKIDLVGIVNSDTFIANLINAEQLNAKFATVEKLSVVNANFDNLNASNLKVGTVSTSRLDLDGILQGFASKTIQGIAIVGQTIRGSQFQVYDGSNYQALSEQSVTIDGVNYRFLGRKV